MTTQICEDVYGLGFFYPQMFTKDYYQSITAEHQFQSLTESNKPGNAYRKGIYLTNVEETPEGTKFKLLRCSTNLDGPTDNFRRSDIEILNQLNELRKDNFATGHEFNHVLAQTYHNHEIGKKQRKAKISEHSDKTKDMPENGLMAFCTFYEGYDGEKFTDPNLEKMKSGLDYKHKQHTALTRLRFRRKKSAPIDTVEQFDITLYPGSVFMMNLDTNRLYTHEIITSVLPISMLPTRMGYVVRCSNTNAIFTDRTYIVKNNGEQEPLVDEYPEGVANLKSVYRTENFESTTPDYGFINFSLNRGDYSKPLA